jgi:anti-sigma regulatory factor (Ser/Thr protein kinase)
VTQAYGASLRGFDELRGLRRGLAAWMGEVGADETTTAEAVLAVVELATNGIEASPTGEVTIRAETVDGTLRIVVINQGPSFRGPIPTPTDVLATRGRGLSLVAALTDSVAFGEVDGMTEVTVSKRFAPTEA